MHLIVALDANLESHKLFPQFIHSIPLKLRDGREFHPVTREIRFYNIILDESGLEQFMPYIKCHEKGTMLSGRSMKTALSLLSKIFPFLDVVDTDKYVKNEQPYNDKKRWREMYPGTLPPYLMVIGSFPDKKNEEGIDML